ncbi:MAG: Glycosyltransferase Gtf1 [Ignavibacteria bacterium]|nr:Glycosyltransferase Gtf1 [Ignavibacteria bacterium]
MKIGIVLSGIPKYSETFFHYKIKGLSEAGFEVKIFTGDKRQKEFPYKQYPAYPVLSGKPLRQFFLTLIILIKTLFIAPKRFLRLYSGEMKDGKSIGEILKTIYINAHIITHELDWLHFGFAATAIRRELAAGVMGAKMGVSFRGYDINIYPLKNPGCYDRLWKNVDKVHTISEYLFQKAVSMGLNSKTPHEKITPAIEPDKFKIRNSDGSLGNRIHILTVGRLNWIKDYETAIETMKILKSKGISFDYNIIGSGSELERLKFAVYQSGLENEVNFFGIKSHEEVRVLMMNTDIYLQTSMQEGFCVSVLEAQAAGLPCIVSDADGLRENVIDNFTGWIVKKRRPDLFAKKIIEVIKMSNEERLEIMNNARARAEKDFSIKLQNEKFRNFFLQI